MLSELARLKNDLDSMQVQLAGGTAMLEQIKKDHQKLVSWADVFMDANPEMQKMIVSSMIKAVRLHRDY